MSSANACTAGIIMIGDEILKGQIIDTNSNFLQKQLHALGIKVCKMVVVSDDIDEIAEEVSRFSNKYNLVFTSGGIGPTHDDITYAGVAKAFNETMILNSDLAKLVQRFYSGRSCTDVNINPALKEALIPTSGKLVYIEPKKNEKITSSYNFAFPIVQVHNVYIFPGIPEYFEFKLSRLENLFRKTANCTFHTRQLYIDAGELGIVRVLNNAVEKYKHTVIFGSYPSLTSDYYQTKITIESTSKDQVEDAEGFLRSQLPPRSVVDYDSIRCTMDTSAGVSQALTNGKYSVAVKKAFDVFEECCDKYRPSEIFLSFNGGKDCTVLLHMASEIFKNKFPDSKEKLQAIYIRSQNPFPEVEAFIEDSLKRYNLDLKTIPGPIKNALKVVLTENPNFKAVLMGTRRTDPFSETLQHFQVTDEGWPQVVRVSPLLDWDYADIWKYLRQLSVPYCHLYDIGYTSLGNHNNTSPNPALRYLTPDGRTQYRPAYTLEDGSAERNGRH